MKLCAYCTTKNRDEAIFCARCKRPLPTSPTRAEVSAGSLVVWFLLLCVLVGLGVTFFSSRALPGAAAAETTTPGANGIPFTGAVPSRTQQPETISACVQEANVHIRRGPGTHYETTGGLTSGTCLTILGRDAEAGWVYMVSDDHKTGWVAVSVLRHTGELSKVSVRDHTLMAYSARPTLTSAEIAHGAQTYLTEVAATNLPQSQFSKYVVPCFETADRVGNHVSCKMEKAYCDYLPDTEGSPTLCSDRPHPDHTFTLVVFDADWSEYDGQCLLVSGYLEISNGSLQVEALDRDQVSACD